MAKSDEIHVLPSSIAILKANRDNAAGEKNSFKRWRAVRRINRLKKNEEVSRLPLVALDLCLLQARRHDDLDENGMFYIDLAPEPGEEQGECITLRAHSPGDAQAWLDEIEKVQEAYGVSDVVKWTGYSYAVFLVISTWFRTPIGKNTSY